jgi:phosphate transport system permease protein
MSRIPVPHRRDRARRRLDTLAHTLCALLAAGALLPLASIVGHALTRGVQALSLSFLISESAPVGESGGGVGHALVGSLLLVGLTTLVALPIGLCAGAYLAEQRASGGARLARLAAELLSSVPSIVVGFVVYALVVLPFGFSALAGVCALVLLVVPPLARATEELLLAQPPELREAALALGLPPWRVTLGVLLPAALPSLVSVSLAILARVVGEAAPLLWTSLHNSRYSLRPDQPIASLPVLIWNGALSPFPAGQRQVWASSLLLLAGVGAMSFLSRRLAFRRRSA